MHYASLTSYLSHVNPNTDFGALLYMLAGLAMSFVVFPLVAFSSVALLTLVFGALTVPPVLSIEWLYRRAILRWMNSPGGPSRATVGRTPETATHARAPSPLRFELHEPNRFYDYAGCPLNRRAEAANWAVTRVYVAAGVAYAAAMTPLAVWLPRSFSHMTSYGDSYSLRSYLMTFGTLLWLPVFVYLIAAVTHRSRKLMVLASYVLLYATAAHFLPTRGGTFIWIPLVAAPTSTLFVLRFSGVGGLMFGAILSCAAVCFPLILRLINYAKEAAGRVGLDGSGVSGPSQSLSAWDVLLVMLTPLVAVSLAMALLWWMSNRYERKKTSEQILLLDGFWLSTTLMISVVVALTVGWYALLGLLAFAAYKLAVWAGLRRLRAAAREGRELRLLLLRVFGAKRSSEWLLARLSHYWRYAGSIQLIAAPDLAAANLELPELLDFMRLRLKRRFLKDSADCARRVESLDTLPDPDGRYRVNEFFCHDNVWPETVAALTERSDVVLMDLRGFTPRNRGCVEELYHLVDAVAVNRLVVIVNNKTDHVFLRRTFEGAWAQMGARSPNRGLASPVLHLINIQRQSARAVSRLLSILGEAAERGAVNSVADTPVVAPVAAPVAAGLRAF